MHDVVVVGGGPVGACAGALLARSGLSVALLEPHPPPAPGTGGPPDSRVVALSRASERILRAAGAWEHIPPQHLSPYERMRIWHERAGPFSADVLVFDAADAGEPNLGYILENRRLQHALLEAFRAAGGTLEPLAFAGLERGAAALTVLTGGAPLAARLLLGADGAHSAVRAAAGLPVQLSAYRQRALVANVATARAHERTAWQRFLVDGTLAFLPLADGTSSIVWSADEARAAALLSLDAPQFNAALEAAADGALGATQLLTARRDFALHRLAAPHYVTEHVALLGDAAHVVHPLAGQGVNLGLLDAAVLAEALADARTRREDLGSLAVLRPYERWRKSEVALMAAAIDAFDRLLAHGQGPLARLAQHGLGLVNRSEELRRFFIRRALGVAGELPRLVRRA
ncbi:MAG: FAD-dependent monooxygenase [Gammaproteobacteria bacterium]|nr:FAD-dependent monooxygenase [Gammaproteobacteria bacterium]MBV9697415.1 FAD-dependent monooxygenase [Gammaproteobacteria bacterium]